MAAKGFIWYRETERPAAEESLQAQKITLCLINLLPGSRTASLAESTQGYTRLPVASTTIPFMAGEWPEPSTAVVLAPVRRSLFHQ